MFVLLAAVILFVLYVSDVHGDGYSSTYRKQDDNGHYSFGYKIKDKKGLCVHKEQFVKMKIIIIKMILLSI